MPHLDARRKGDQDKREAELRGATQTLALLSLTIRYWIVTGAACLCWYQVVSRFRLMRTVKKKGSRDFYTRGRVAASYQGIGCLEGVRIVRRYTILKAGFTSETPINRFLVGHNP